MSISALLLAALLQAPGDGWPFVHDTGEGLGFPFRLSLEDQRLLSEFAGRAGLGPEPR